MATRPAYDLDEEGPAPVRWTAEQFLRMDDLGAFDDTDDKLELVDGEIIRMSSRGWSHGRMQHRLGMLLEAALADTGMLIAGETGVITNWRSVRGPDLVVVRGEPAGSERLKPEQVVLAVEIAGAKSRSRDLNEKPGHYARAGLPRYWVVDLTKSVTHVMAEPDEDGYAARAQVRFDMPLAVPESGMSITIG